MALVPEAHSVLRRSLIVAMRVQLLVLEIRRAKSFLCLRWSKESLLQVSNQEQPTFVVVDGMMRLLIWLL